MPLYEYECKACRKNVDDSLAVIGKKADKKTVTELVKKYDNINHIGVLDMEKEDVIGEHGERDGDAVDLNFYLNEGTTMVFMNLRKNFRFSELIYEEKDEKKVKCPFCNTKKVEKVVSSFAFTTDLSTNMPKPDLSNLPPSVRNKTKIGQYIEEKDRPKKNK
jgi:predicted nucleic acid-binding Zn ribbon protein